jgi:hypothetical protein
MWTESSASRLNFVSFERPWFNIVELRYADCW